MSINCAYYQNNTKQITLSPITVAQFFLSVDALPRLSVLFLTKPGLLPFAHEAHFTPLFSTSVS